jgi:hypothetical protein
MQIGFVSFVEGADGIYYSFLFDLGQFVEEGQTDQPVTDVCGYGAIAGFCA